MSRLLTSLVVVSMAAGSVGAALPAWAVQAPPRVDACALLTRAEVKAFLPWEPMFDQMALERDEIGETGSACGYPTVMIQVLAYSDRFLEQVQKVRPQESVAGVGERAYVSHNPQGYVEFFAKVGARTLTLQAHIDRGGSYEQTKAKTLALAKALAARLK